MHPVGLVVHVTYFFAKTLTDFGEEIITTLGIFAPFGNVREEACSLHIPLASGVTQRVEYIVPALQTYHTREGELRRVATEIVQEPGTSF